MRKAHRVHYMTCEPYPASVWVERGGFNSPHRTHRHHHASKASARRFCQWAEDYLSSHPGIPVFFYDTGFSMHLN